MGQGIRPGKVEKTHFATRPGSGINGKDRFHSEPLQTLNTALT